jgi:hypothetical protein
MHEPYRCDIDVCCSLGHHIKASESAILVRDRCTYLDWRAHDDCPNMLNLDPRAHAGLIPD